MKATSQRITIRRSEERGKANHGWLDSHHTFSFARYYDPAHMGFGALRVINQDTVAPNEGFPTHPHDNMEIFSYVLEGSLAHEDSMGNKRTLYPGEIQLMSAGSGVTHSECNPSSNEPLHFLQIWIQPDTQNLDPTYTEWKPSPEQAADSKTLIISPNGAENSATIHQDAFIYRLKIKAGETVTHKLTENRAAWLQIIKGKSSVNDSPLMPGDAASTQDQGKLVISATSDTEALLFDLKQ